MDVGDGDVAAGRGGSGTRSPGSLTHPSAIHTPRRGGAGSNPLPDHPAIPTGESAGGVTPTPDATSPDIPTALPWDQRFKGVDPLPGGYDGYLTCLENVCHYVQDDRPQLTQLHRWLMECFKLTAGSVEIRMSFLVRVGLLDMRGDVCSVAALTRRWLDTGESAVIIAQLHSRTQFIGEMLNELRAAHDSGSRLHTWDVLMVAKERYGFGWTSAKQIDSRRGWLQSAGLVSVPSDKQFQVTPAGHALLERLELHVPTAEAALAKSPQEPAAASRALDPLPGAVSPESAQHSPPAEERRDERPDTHHEPAAAAALASELRASSVHSADHTRLEAAVRDAFEFLGFRAERLGGSGKTDVLLNAIRGKDHSYRVTVDAKSVGESSSSKGRLRDQQVDWVTLQEHRTNHRADHSMLIGPDPTGERIFARAREYGVTIMSSDELAQLCLQHEEMPLGLGDYEALFAEGGHIDMSPLDGKRNEVARRRDLARAVVGTLADECERLGPMSAGQIQALLKDHPWAEEEIQQVLNVLSGDLVAAVELAPSDSESPTTYIPATSLAVAQLRLRKLAEALGSSGP